MRRVLSAALAADAPRCGRNFSDCWNLFDFVILASVHRFLPDRQRHRNRLLVDVQTSVSILGHDLPSSTCLLCSTVFRP